MLDYRIRHLCHIYSTLTHSTLTSTSKFNWKVSINDYCWTVYLIIVIICYVTYFLIISLLLFVILLFLYPVIIHMGSSTLLSVLILSMFWYSVVILCILFLFLLLRLIFFEVINYRPCAIIVMIIGKYLYLSFSFSLQQVSVNCRVTQAMKLITTVHEYRRHLSCGIIVFTANLPVNWTGGPAMSKHY